MPRALPPLEQPLGAIAMVQQMCSIEQTYYPRGMPNSRPEKCTRPRRRQGKVVNPSFQHALDGFLATRFVEVGEREDFLRCLEAAEAAEFAAAAAFSPKDAMRDNTLPPRACSALLLLPGRISGTDSGREALSAFACLAAGKGCSSGVASATVMRFAALADTDAELFLRSVGHEAAETVWLAVRWLVGADIKTCVYEIGLHGFRQAQLRMQNVFFAAQKEGAPVDSIVFASRDPAADSDFQTLQKTLHDDFFALQSHEVNLVQPGVELVQCKDSFVRFVARPGHVDHIEPALAHAGACHGVLLCKQEGREVLEGLMAGTGCMPLCDNGLDAFGIHVIGVNLVQLPLGPRVTLYAASGAPGESLSPSGSWIWRFDTMAVPYTLQFSHEWYVMPCTAESTTAGHPQLKEPQEHLMQRVADLASSVLRGTMTEVAAAAAAQARRRAVAMRDQDDDDERAETPASWLTSALCLGLPSRRTTLGDFCRHLEGQAHFGEFSEFIREATLRFGLETSLPQAFQRAHSVLHLEDERAKKVSAETEMWRRVATGANAISARCASPGPVRPKAVQKILEFLDFEQRSAWKRKRQILEEMKQLVGAETLPAAVQEIAESYDDGKKTVLEVLIGVASCYLQASTPILVMDRKLRVIEASCAGVSGSYRVSMGEALNLAAEASLLFLVDVSSIVIPCAPMSKEAKAKRREQRNEVAKEMAARSSTPVPEPAPAPPPPPAASASASGSGSGSGAKRPRPMQMPTAPNPKFSIRAMKAQSVKARAKSALKKQKAEEAAADAE